jgi:hypothetical protein
MEKQKRHSDKRTKKKAETVVGASVKMSQAGGSGTTKVRTKDDPSAGMNPGEAPKKRSDHCHSRQVSLKFANRPHKYEHTQQDVAADYKRLQQQTREAPSAKPFERVRANTKTHPTVL